MADTVTVNSLTFITKDGDRFNVSKENVKYLETIKDMLMGIDDSSGEVPLDNVDGKTFKKIVEYLDTYVKDPHPVNETDIDADTQWELEYVTPLLPNDPVLEPLILAAEYLRFMPLYRCLCRGYARSLRQMLDLGEEAGPAKVREVYGLKDDIPAEEKERIKKENAWLKDD